MLTFDSTGGSACASIEVEVGGTYGQLPSPSKSHYKFTGWHLDSPSGELVTSSTIVDYYNTTLYASWDPALVIDWDGTTNGGSAVTTTNEYFIGDPFGELPASPTKSGYTFIGWFTTPSGKEFITEQSIVDSSHTHLYARYMDFQNSTQFQIQPTSTSYRKVGIYSATRRSSSEVIAVDWGDGKTTCVDGSISQIVHEYASTGTYTVKVSDNISDIRISHSSSTWYQTTTSLRYNFKKMLAWSTNVTQLLDRAFYYCYYMTDVVLPANITSIPTYCFYYCYNIQSIDIPSTVISFQNYAFQGCYNLKNIVIPTGVSTLASYAFAGCYNLTSITCQRQTAPTASYGTFGYSTYSPYYYVGYGTRSTGNNTLNILPNATGYDTGYWNSPLRNASYCGFNVKYIGDPCYVTFDAAPGNFAEGISGNVRYVKLVVDEMQNATGNNYIQISRLELIKNDGTLYQWPSSTQISLPSWVGAQAGQSPDKMLDHSTSTKFCAAYASTFSPYDIIFDVGDANVFNASDISCWQWWTAGDSATCYGRNMKAFKLKFSIDGSNYVTVDEVNNYSVPSQNNVLAYQGDVQTTKTTTKTIEYIQGNTYGSLPIPNALLSTPYLSGWFDDPIAGNKITKNSIVPETSSLTLYARYTDEAPQFDYIQFTGTQYIDTGITPTNHFTEVKYYVPTYVNDGHILGTSSGATYYHWTEYNNGTQKYFWGLNGSEANGGSWSSAVHVMKMNEGSNYNVILDGTTLGSGSLIYSSTPLWIGRRDSTTNFQGYIYYCKITDKSTGQLVRDLVPAIDENEIVCMFDNVSQTYFYNQGTGDLIGGND